MLSLIKFLHEKKEYLEFVNARMEALYIISFELSINYQVYPKSI